MAMYRSARECLSAVAAHYATLRSYSDEGIVRRRARNAAPDCWFNTRFAHGKFRFQFTTPHPYRKLRHVLSECVVGTDGVTPYFWSRHYSGAPMLDREERIEMVVAGATGISRGSAHTIGALLLKDVGGFSTFRDLRRPRFRQMQDWDGVPCYRISGLHPFGHRYTLWIGQHDLLLRRILRHERSNREELRRNIRINEPIPEDTFAVPQLES